MQICGLDEAGRGALAGPLVGAVTILNFQLPISNLRDSKKLSSKKRERLYEQIVESGARVETEIVSARQINNRGIGWANKEIFKRLIKRIEADKYIVDGMLILRVQGKSHKIKSVVSADATRKCVMAASIIAKVTRDKIMEELHKKYPKYNWSINKGYGTKRHLEAIRAYGETRYHRGVFVRTAFRNLARVRDASVLGFGLI